MCPLPNYGQLLSNGRGVNAQLTTKPVQPTRATEVTVSAMSLEMQRSAFFHLWSLTIGMRDIIEFKSWVIFVLAAATHLI